MKRANENSALLLLLLLLAALSAGCATKLPDSTPVQPPQIPSLPPTLAKPVPPESFLERAQKSTQAWREKLISSETK